MLRYDRFGTFGFDLGIYDQGIWLLSRAKDPFVTIRGLELFGHHANVFLLLLVPFYWLGAGPIFLLVVQVLAQASGAIAVFLLARDLLQSKWAGVALGARPVAQPDVSVARVGVLPSRRGRDRSAAVRVLGGAERRWGWFTVAAILTVFCKEDFALAVAVIGLRHLVPGRSAPRRDRRGRVDRLFLLRHPSADPGAERHRAVLRQLLRRSRQVADGGRVQLVRHPGETWHLASAGDRQAWYWHVFAPWAFVPFLDLRVLAIAVADDLHQHRVVVPVHTRLPVPLLGDRRCGMRGRDRRGDRVDLEAAKERLATHVRRWCRWSLVVAVVTERRVGLRPVLPPLRDGAWPLAADPRVP